MANEMENPWTTLRGRQVYSNPWIEVTEYDVLNPAGKPGIYGKVHFKNKAIGVVPVDEAGHIWLVGQYRYPLDQYSWEIPEGGGPLHLSSEESALRELKEETGLSAEHLEHILTMHLSNSVSDEVAHIYLATGLSEGEAEPEETEQLHLRKVHLDHAYAMVLSGEITDSLTVAGILRVQLMRIEGRLKF